MRRPALPSPRLAPAPRTPLLLRKVPLLRTALLPLALLLGACPEVTDPPPPPGDPVRCEVELDATGLFPAVGGGARAVVLSGGDPLPTGPEAAARAGDVLLENDRVRVVLRQPGTAAGPVPFGGAVVDADVRRPAGQPWQDALAGLGLFAAFGRSVEVTRLEVLESGTTGGRAVVAATGMDARLPGLAVEERLDELLGPGEHVLRVDPDAALDLQVSTYAVAVPGEPRVRLLSALCNHRSTPLTLPLGDVLAPGAGVLRFNASGCVGDVEDSSGCAVDVAGVLAFQADGVAYGYRTGQLADPRRPETANSLLTLDGVSLVVAGGRGRDGLLAWTNPQVSPVPGAVTVPAGGQQLFLRDLYVTRDLAELHSVLLAEAGRARSRLVVDVQDASGAPAPGARVSVVSPDGRLVTLMVADASGVGRVDLEPAGYRLVARVAGGSGGEVTGSVNMATGGSQTVTLRVGGS